MKIKMKINMRIKKKIIEVKRYTKKRIELEKKKRKKNMMKKI